MSRQYNNALMADLHGATNNETLDAERNLALFERLKAGDAAAREEMIVGNIPLAVAKVEGFIRCFPDTSYLRDDLTSAAMVGLTKAVNKMAAGKGPRKRAPSAPVDFIGMWINRELGRLVEDETTIRVPHTSKARARSEGQGVTPPTIVNDVPERWAVFSYQKDLEIRDLIEACCTTEVERRFVAMRRARHTLAAIADALGVPTHTISNLQRRLKGRIRKRLEKAGQLFILPTKTKRSRSPRRSRKRRPAALQKSP